MTALIRALQQAKRAAILSHVSPDGDAAGSALALSMALQALGAEAQVLLPGPIGDEYHFLHGVDTIRYPEDEVEDDFDLIVCVDCGDRGRVGFWQYLLEKSAPWSSSIITSPTKALVPIALWKATQRQRGRSSPV